MSVYGVHARGERAQPDGGLAEAPACGWRTALRFPRSSERALIMPDWFTGPGGDLRPNYSLEEAATEFEAKVWSRIEPASHGLGVLRSNSRGLRPHVQPVERERGNSTRTRNNRLAALHSFFKFVAIQEPALTLQCQRVLALPSKRYTKGPIAFLTDEETAALVSAPDPRTWIGRRDKALLLVAVQTGLSNSEITSLCRRDVEFGVGAHVCCFGKGRKTRRTPLRPDVAAVLKAWLAQQAGHPEDPIFPSSNGGRLSADALQHLVAKHIAAARLSCPSLKAKKVKPHTLRHAAAMSLLHRGVDLSVIALWLGPMNQPKPPKSTFMQT